MNQKPRPFTIEQLIEERKRHRAALQKAKEAKRADPFTGMYS